MLERTAIILRASRLRWLIVATVVVGLSGCGGDARDLREYIDQVKARPGGRIAPLPDILPAPSFAYEESERRSPFAPDTRLAGVSVDPNAVQGPDPNRPREYLEQFSLDTLTMVGTLDSQGNSFGLLQTTDRLVHRVTVGNHLGQNYGRIMAITDSEIQLVEIIPDGLGGFLERPARVGLSD